MPSVSYVLQGELPGGTTAALAAAGTAVLTVNHSGCNDVARAADVCAIFWLQGELPGETAALLQLAQLY